MSGSFTAEEKSGLPYRCPTVVIVDRRPLARSCLARILRSEFSEAFVLEFDTVHPLDSLAGKEIGLVVVNIQDRAMTDDWVLSNLATLRRSLADVPVMLLAQLDEAAISDAAISEVARFGVRGCVTDRASIEIALAALRLVIAGGVYFPRSVVLDCASWAPAPTEDIVVIAPAPCDAPTIPARPAVAFTQRERQVLATLQRGLSNKIIASELNLSQNTVKVHLSRIMRKLKTTNRTEAALLAQRNLFNGNGQLSGGMNN